MILVDCHPSSKSLHRPILTHIPLQTKVCSGLGYGSAVVCRLVLMTLLESRFGLIGPFDQSASEVRERQA